MSPRCEPQNPPMTAGLPSSVPLIGSAPGTSSQVFGPGKTRCWCPVKTASMPATPAR